MKVLRPYDPLMSISRSVGFRLVGWSICHDFRKGWEEHLLLNALETKFAARDSVCRAGVSLLFHCFQQTPLHQLRHHQVRDTDMPGYRVYWIPGYKLEILGH